jgi:predicted nucleic acid-binding protein
MKYLLDVNVLLILCHGGPQDRRLHTWLNQQADATYHTCAITELGFLRITMAAYRHSRETATRALAYAQRDVTGYIDTLPPPSLANWVLSHGQTTDAYLCQLAAANGMRLATLDTGIKDKAAFVIP